MHSEQSSSAGEWVPVYDTRFDSEHGQSPVGAVVEALSAVQDADPTERAPLYDAVDGDALNTLFDRADEDLVVQFGVDDWRVVVRGDGRVQVCDADPASADSTAVEPATED